MADPALHRNLRAAELSAEKARVALTILRGIVARIEPGEQVSVELIEEAVVLTRTLRRTLDAWQKVYASDPLVAQLFLSRKNFRATDARRGKSLKRVDRVIQDSYLAAMRLGYGGSINEWHELLVFNGR